jgi:hypothetical protein
MLYQHSWNLGKLEIVFPNSTRVDTTLSTRKMFLNILFMYGRKFFLKPAKYRESNHTVTI